MVGFEEIIVKDVFVEMVFNVLQWSFDHFVQLISTQKDLPTFEELTSKLLHQEQRRSIKNKQHSNFWSTLGEVQKIQSIEMFLGKK